MKITANRDRHSSVIERVWSFEKKLPKNLKIQKEAMKLIVKKLQGDECSLDVLPTTLISEIKNGIEKQLGIPVVQQRLLLFGRTLADDQTVQSYSSLKDGSKLNLVVKKPDSFFSVSVKHFKKLGLTDSAAVSAANRLMKVTQDKFNKFSWDDIERLANDCLLSGVGIEENINMSY